MPKNYFPRARRWRVDVQSNTIPVTSDREQYRPTWDYTDKAGHYHSYESVRDSTSTYTVIHESHWCDGTEGGILHGAHKVIDRCDFKCVRCQEVIHPAMDPPGTVTYVQGMVDVSIVGVRSDGANIAATIMNQEQYDELEAICQTLGDFSEEEGERFDRDIEAFLSRHPECIIKVWRQS